MNINTKSHNLFKNSIFSIEKIFAFLVSFTLGLKSYYKMGENKEDGDDDEDKKKVSFQF